MRNQLLAVCCLVALIGCRQEDDATNGKVVFQSSRDGNFEIYSMNADGTNLLRLTNSPSNDITPSWSPDGNSIAFASDRSGNWEIYSLRADGSQLTQLTKDLGTNTSPNWTADGKKIVFISTRDANNGDVYMMNPDGSGVERMTNDSTAKDGVLMRPDGKSIIVSVMAHGHHHLAIVSLADKTSRTIGSGDHNSMSPTLSADGTMLAYADDQSGSYQLYTVGLPSAEPTRVTHDNVDHNTPAWAGNLREIIVSKKGGLYLLSLRDGKEKMLSFKGDSAPHWHSR